MKWMICISILIVWTGLDVHKHAFAQNSQLENTNTKAVTEQKQDTTRVNHGGNDPIIANPDPKLGRPGIPGYMMQTAGFLSTAGGGVELTYRQEDRSLFGNTYFGAVINPDKKISGAGTILTGGLNIGVEIALNPRGTNVHGSPVTLSTERDGIRFYTRVAPGVSFIHVRRPDGDNELHAGINTMAVLGASTHVKGGSFLFMEMGARAAWFPGLSELRYLAAPQLAVGIQFF